MIDILNTITDYVLVVDENGCIMFANTSLLNKLKYTLDELRDLNSILVDKDFNFIIEQLNENKSVHNIDLYLYNSTKDKVLFNGNIKKSTFENKEAFVIICNCNSTDKEEMRNEFFGNISHEFKTPLNLILGTIQLIEKNVAKGNINSVNGTDLNRHTKCIKQNSYRLLRLANNIIDMTRIETGYYQLQLGNHNIINIIEEITLSVSSYMETKGINLVFDTDCEELTVACDPDKIERIVLNLLSNSIKYTDNGGEINVLINTFPSKVRVSIRDNGSGISQEKLPHIFERYVQDDRKYRVKSEGSGIGLSLVKSLVNMHDGDIYVNSELGEGSEFTFEIPIRVIQENSIEKFDLDNEHLRIEKCNVEFSDVYSM